MIDLWDVRTSYDNLLGTRLFTVFRLRLMKKKVSDLKREVAHHG
jgi:hypothetical protein